MADDEALLAEPEAKKPEQPLPFDENVSMEEIEKRALECRRPPGEPRIHLELVTSNGNSSSNESHDNRELNR